MLFRPTPRKPCSRSPPRFAWTASVTEADVALAREHGASNTEIHDTVLIAAAFCMYNRNVDGLATTAPTDLDAYQEMGRRNRRARLRRPETGHRVIRVSSRGSARMPLSSSYVAGQKSGKSSPSPGW